MSDMSDGLGMLPRPGEPELATLPGMAAPIPRDVERAIAGAGSPKGGLPGVGALSMPDTSSPGPTALQEPGAWAYDFDPGTGASRATFNGVVAFTSGGSATDGVTTFNTRSGSVTLTQADVTGAGGATSANAALTGTPTAPTPAAADSSTTIATTAFVKQAITANLTGYAPTASPTFTGIVSLPQVGVTGPLIIAPGGTIQPATVAGIMGTTAADNAQVGSIGEFRTIYVSTPQGLSNATPATFTGSALSLPAGDWDVWGFAYLSCSISATLLYCSISNTPAVLGSGGATAMVGGSSSNVGAIQLAIMPFRVNSAALTTWYIVCQANFGSGTATIGAAQICARRMR